ncbi:hypothetical protein ACNPAA_12255, partial [Aeromonas sp. PS2Canimalfood6]|uniref:hypothetical protein n=1 Tax=Aeromonas sp. PS2Canimalfood6 TaxID=3397770 RepID=UPI003AA7C291
AFPGVGFCLGEGQEIDWIGHTEYSETRIEQLDHIFNLIGIIEWIPMRDPPHNFHQFPLYKCYPAHTPAETV